MNNVKRAVFFLLSADHAIDIDLSRSGIIPAKYIAGVMNDGKFSGHLITEETQIIFMDEWTPDSLSCEDAKRVLQGNGTILSIEVFYLSVCLTYNTHGIHCFFIIILGGLVFLPQKHKEASRVRYNSGIFITTNVYPDFGHDHDNQAIRRRLDVFNTSALQRKDGSVSGKFDLMNACCVVFCFQYISSY